MVQKINSTICAYPWRSAAIRPNGAVIPCCRYPNLNDSDCFVDSPNPRESNHWKDLRERMLNGIQSNGCISCYQDENNGLLSMRKESLQKFIPIENVPKKIEQLEVSFSNLCNLACAHCSNYYSTKWYSEDAKHGRIKNIGIVKNNFTFEHWDLSNLYELKIIGGEPFMEQPKFIEFLKNLELKNVSIQICTNGTIMPNTQLKSLIEQCKNVYLCISLDGLYSTNDWYRWPSKFIDVVSNMKLYEEIWGQYTNVDFVVHHVVNAINIFELKDFVDYMEINFPKWRIEWDWIRWPRWQQLSVFPHAIKKNLLNALRNYNDNYVNKNELLRSNPYDISIQRILEKPESDWETLQIEIIKLSMERNLNYHTMLNKNLIVF